VGALIEGTTGHQSLSVVHYVLVWSGVMNKINSFGQLELKTSIGASFVLDTFPTRLQTLAENDTNGCEK
jgi:hypothetical protein